MAPRILFVAAALCCVSACRSTEFCTTSIEPGIIVRIRDSKSKLPAAEGASGYVRDGSYVDSLRTAEGDAQGVLISLQAAFERPGVYTIVVVNDGYQTWKKDGVKVGSDECHVRTVYVTADLVKVTK
jgi:hypothetical protein